VSVRKASATVFVLGVVLLGACRQKQEQPTAGAGSHQVPIICSRCQATGTLTLASEAKRESWPKVCPTCKRWAAYASGQCKSCGKLVPLKDTRTDSFGYPEICPYCSKPWQQ
jgi:hypothetical protein